MIIGGAADNACLDAGDAALVQYRAQRAGGQYIGVLEQDLGGGNDFGTFALAAGDRAAAATLLEECVALARELAALDPTDAAAQSDLATTLA